MFREVENAISRFGSKDFCFRAQRSLKRYLAAVKKLTKRSSKSKATATDIWLPRTIQHLWNRILRRSVKSTPPPIPSKKVSISRLCRSNGSLGIPSGHSQTPFQDGWHTFMNKAPFFPPSVFDENQEYGSVLDRRFKEEPYSAPQQILRIEDIPPFLISIQRNGDALYPSPIPVVGSDCLPLQDPNFFNAPPSSSSRPVYYFHPEGRKVVGVCENYKQPQLSSTLLSARMANGSQDMPAPGHFSFPCFNMIPNGNPLLENPQFPLEPNLSLGSLNDVQQDAMCVQNLMRNTDPVYNFPSHQ